MAHFGFCSRTWHEAVRRGGVTPRPKAMPIEELIAGRRNRSHLKQRLVAAGLMTPRCDECGLVEWRGPNCHSQTENFGGRNKRRIVG